MPEEKTSRIWAKTGVGDPPLLHDLEYWPDAVRETKALTSQQYWHIADQLREMCRSDDPCRCETVDIAPISSFWELKEKGGPLGNINLRVFFHVHSENERKSVVVLGVHKKEDEDQLRRSVIVRIERRQRLLIKSFANKE